MKSIKFLALALSALVFAACQPGKNQEESAEIAKEQNDDVFEDRDDEKDADFVVNAISASIAEINLAQLALNKSTDSEVKKIATMLEADHTKVLQSLQGYAATKGISTPTSQTEDAAKDTNDLAEENGNDFDEKWCEKLAANHNQSIRKFESRMNKTEDVALKDLIANTLPNLKSHLQMLEQHNENSKKQL
jgi:putative membrane protein